MATSDKKLFLGGRLKRLRRDLGVTQAAMAEQLKVSPSYLNLLERNQRPVTAQVLLRLAEAYDLDLRSLSADEPGGGAGLEEALADKMFADLAIGRLEAADVMELSPGLAEAFVRLYRAWLDRGALIDLGAFDGRDSAARQSPTNWVRDLVSAQRNHFAELEELAEDLLRKMAADPRDLAPAVRERLQAGFGVRTRIMPTEAMTGALRRYDRHRKQLLIAETLAPPSRTFAMTFQLGLMQHGEAIAEIAGRFAPPDHATLQQLKVFLGNYLAAAIMMPYATFLAALEETGYDLERVRARFGASFEQAAQRITTLDRAGRPRHSLLHGAGRCGRQHFQALFERPLPLLPFRRNLSALEHPRQLQNARPDGHSGDRNAGRRALFHPGAHGAAGSGIAGGNRG